MVIRPAIYTDVTGSNEIMNYGMRNMPSLPSHLYVRSIYVV